MYFPEVPSLHAAAVLALTLVALILFSRDKIPIETSGLFIVVLLATGFTLFPIPNHEIIETSKFFAGFGNEALVAITALMIASQSLVTTGALTPLGRIISRYWALAPMISFLLVLLVTAIISAFMNNTPQVVLMIPILISVALRAGMPASKTLMPMTFSAQIGGMGTPIGTSLNLLVLATAASMGVEKFGMFDFIVPATIAGAIGILYLWLVAPLLIPFRQHQLADTSPRVYTAQLVILENSFANGKTISEILEVLGTGVRINRVSRNNISLVQLPDLIIEEKDLLWFQEAPEKLKEIEQTLGGKLYTGDVEIDFDQMRKDKKQQLAELVITRSSPLNGKSLAQVSFDERYEIIPLAIHKAGVEIEIKRADLQKEIFSVGDVLLVQGETEKISQIKKRHDFMVLDGTSNLPESSKAPLALGIMGAIILLASFNILPVSVSALLGVFVMILTGCLTWQDANRALDSKLIFLTVASIALSYAMVQTGAAGYLADVFIHITKGLKPEHILCGLILFMGILSNIISNSAAAVIGTPIAINIAQGLDASPQAFVLAVLFGVNMSYATPMADNCNLIVYSAGGYKFTDFLRVGIPLTLIMWLSYSILLPMYFPL